jgi:hypothetical protein
MAERLSMLADLVFVIVGAYFFFLPRVAAVVPVLPRGGEAACVSAPADASPRESGAQTPAPGEELPIPSEPGKGMIRWENPELAAQAVDLRIEIEGETVRAVLGGKACADFAEALKDLADRSPGKPVRLLPAGGLTAGATMNVYRQCEELGLKPFFPLRKGAE